ncbi:MAG: MacS family sensor histidine kinase [Streptosporangiaceae bacterium]
MSLQAPLWRSIAVFRFASLIYAAVLIAIRPQYYQYWGWAWVVLAAMIAWTVASSVAYAKSARPTWPVLGADLIVTVLALLSTAILQTPHATKIGVMPVTATWLAGPALAWAVAIGARAGVAAALVIGACVVSLRWPISGAYSSTALDGPVILLLAAALVGYVSILSARAERALQRATEIEAASRERERLARRIHDSVLQVLAMVQRRGAEAGGEAAELGQLAGEQEAALRALITGDDLASAGSGELDLSAHLSREASALVSVITPADPVILTEQAVTEMTAAVKAAIDNVRRHCGAAARTWVLVDDEGAAVTVTIRDDGPGIPAGRLTEAAAEGRLGVSQSISGRIRDLGGSADISSKPGAGTEVRLRVPRAVLPA